MSKNYYHEARGDYSIAEQKIRLNFKALAGNPVQAELTLMHEWTHRLLADTDFGQAAHVFYQIIPHITNVSKEDVIAVANYLYDEQKFVQEGFATYVQYGRLIKLKNQEEAEKWRNSAVHPEYKKYLDDLLFAFNFSPEERDLFLGKITYLVMETGIRKKAPKEDIFLNNKNMEKFILQEDNNPNLRLNKAISAIKKNKKIIHNNNEKLAQSCGISYNKPSTPEEIAEFLNHVSSFTDSTRKYTITDIKDALPPSAAISQSMDDLVVVNLNFNFVDSATIEFDHKDFTHYADQIEIIFTTSHTKEWDQWDVIFSQTKRDPEVGLIGFLKDGTKIITYATKNEASAMINNELKDVTFATHWTWFDNASGKLKWSDNVREPNIVVYETTKYMREVLENSKNHSSFAHLHAGMMEDHPLQTLYVKIGDRSSIHIVNHFANKNIASLIDIFREKSTVMDKEYLLANKKHINNILSSWMGLYWEVDWVEGMLDPGVQHFRL